MSTILINMMTKRIRLEILFVIMVKISLLIALWYVCFSHPISKELNTNKLTQHFVQTK